MNFAQFPKGSIIIASFENGKLNFSDNPKIHNSSITAKTEAARLASSMPGKQFVVLQTVGTAYSKKPKVSWE